LISFSSHDHSGEEKNRISRDKREKERVVQHILFLTPIQKEERKPEANRGKRRKERRKDAIHLAQGKERERGFEREGKKEKKNEQSATFRSCEREERRLREKEKECRIFTTPYCLPQGRRKELKFGEKKEEEGGKRDNHFLSVLQRGKARERGPGNGKKKKGKGGATLLAAVAMPSRLKGGKRQGGEA